MSPEQKELARHALGLKPGHVRSYRNRYVTGPGRSDYEDLMAMVDAGMAIRGPRGQGLSRNWFTFKITPSGARVVIQDGEQLCPREFPDQVRHA